MITIKTPAACDANKKCRMCSKTAVFVAIQKRPSGTIIRDFYCGKCVVGFHKYEPSEFELSGARQAKAFRLARGGTK